VLEGSRQQLVTDAAALMTGRDKQFRQKPQVTTHPAQGEADDIPIVFGHPQAVWVVLQGK
jgi:hypothetical protein